MDPSTTLESRLRRVPQQARSRDRVEKILDTAAAQVVEHGVDAVGTRGIAEAADVPVASLYQYFADKDDILLALVERDVKAMDTQVVVDLGALTRISVSSIVETTMSAFVKIHRRQPAFVMIWLRGRTNQAIRDYCRRHNRELAKDLYTFAADLGLFTEEAEPLHVELAVEMGDRLFQLAFEDSLDGDQAIIDEAVRVVCAYLNAFATATGRDGVPV